MVTRGRLFIQTPGPTNIPERVLQAVARSGIDFASPRFRELAAGCLHDLKSIFKTEGEVFAFAANGHGAWEAALQNLFTPGDAVLAPTTGRFSAVWAEMGRKLGLEVIETRTDWRSGIDIDLAAEILGRDRDHRIKGILAVHTETATGVRNDLPALRAVLDQLDHPALLVADTIASLAIEEFAMDDWGIDAALAASQKGLMMPVGMSFLALGPRALERTRSAQLPRAYWDVQFRLGDEVYRWFYGTPPEQLVFGLREALDMIAEEGLDQAISRHRRLADAVRAAVTAWGRGGALEINAINPHERANAVTGVRVSEPIDPEAIRSITRAEFNVALGGGLAELTGKVFRIGHLGDLNEAMIIGTLGAVELSLKRSGAAFGEGGVAAAIDRLAGTG